VVQPEEILQRLRKRPFQQFRVVLKDGKHYDILNHENNIVYTWAFSIGVAVDGTEDPITDHVEFITLDQIDRLETLLTSAQQAS
jgi:hypothetical protein